MQRRCKLSLKRCRGNFLTRVLSLLSACCACIVDACCCLQLLKLFCFELVSLRTSKRMSLVVSPEFARAMALELVRRYDFDPNFVFATVLLFVVFTFVASWLEPPTEATSRLHCKCRTTG